jgi:hypothetical protein
MVFSRVAIEPLITVNLETTLVRQIYIFVFRRLLAREIVFENRDGALQANLYSLLE